MKTNIQSAHLLFSFEQHRKKTCFRGFPTTSETNWFYSHRRWLEAGNFGFSKKRDCTIYVAKTKALISCGITVQLICTFVFAYAKSRFPRDVAHLYIQRN